MQSPPLPRYLVPSRSKYSQHHVLKHPQLPFLPQYQRSIFTPIKKQAKLQFYISWSLNFWITTWKTKYSTPNDSKHFLTSICFNIRKYPKYCNYSFRGETDKNFVPLGYCAAISGNYQCFGTIYLCSFQGSIIESWPLKMGPIGCPETSVMNYHYSLRNSPEERGSLSYKNLFSNCFIQQQLMYSVTMDY